MIDYQDRIAYLQNFPEGANLRRQNNIVNKHATVAVSQIFSYKWIKGCVLLRLKNELDAIIKKISTNSCF